MYVSLCAFVFNSTSPVKLQFFTVRTKIEVATLVEINFNSMLFHFHLKVTGVTPKDLQYKAHSH